MEKVPVESVVPVPPPPESVTETPSIGLPSSSARTLPVTTPQRVSSMAPVATVPLAATVKGPTLAVDQPAFVAATDIVPGTT